MTFVPGQPPAIKPDKAIVLGADATLAFANGALTFLTGTAGAAGTRKLVLKYSRIKAETIKATAAIAATAKVVTAVVGTPDYAATNPRGISAIHIDYYDGRMTVPLKASYVVEANSAITYTAAQRAADLVKKINADGAARWTASNSGATITITAKYVGEDFAVTLGEGVSTLTVTTPAAKAFGTGPFLIDAGVVAPAAAYASGKSYKTVMFTYEDEATLAGDGDFKGRSVGNNAHAFVDTAVFLFFETTAADALFTTFEGYLSASGVAAASKPYLQKIAGSLIA
jgi:hypothetical protein